MPPRSPSAAVPCVVLPCAALPQTALPCSLTLRIDTPRAARTHRCLRDALGNAIQIDDIATDCRGGRSTLLLHTDPGHLDALMHTIMTSLPEAEFGPIGRMGGLGEQVH